MITMLAKLFIANSRSYSTPEVRQKYGVLCGLAGICFNLLLFAGKFLGGVLSGSIAITADAFNNLSDAGSSIVTAIGFRLSGSKPDSDHPFGHGRIEYISGLIVSMIILVVGFELFKSSLKKIINPEPVEFSVVAVVILIASIAVKFYMAFYNTSIGKKIGSTAMKAVARDSLSDCIATSSVLLSMFITKYAGINTDGWFGLLVALFVLYTGFISVKDTISPLLGQQPDPELVSHIEEIVLSCQEIVGIHDLIVHDYGPGRRMISLHAEVPVESDILEMHDAIDNIEKELLSKTGCFAVIHMDPISTNDPETNKKKEIVETLVKKIDERLTIHDFRTVAGKTHTNLIFDVVVPYDIKKTDQQIKQEIAKLICRTDKSLYSVVEIDRSFIDNDCH